MSSVAGVAPIPARLGDAQGEPITILGFATAHDDFRGDTLGPIIVRPDGSLLVVDLDAVTVASPGELRRGWSADAEALAELDRSWISVHYAMRHESVPLGRHWPSLCTDEPCPAIRSIVAGSDLMRGMGLDAIPATQR